MIQLNFEAFKIKTVILRLLFYFLFFQTGFANTPADAAVAHWAFDEGSGFSAQDSSGNGHGGTLHGGAEWVTGISGTSLSFDGTASYVEIDDTSELDLTGGEFTLSAWIYPESYGGSGNGRIIDHGGGSSGQGGWSFLVNNATTEHNLRISTMNGSTSAHIYSNTGSISLNSWQHVAVTLTSGVITFYVNGQNAGQTSGVPSPSDRIGPVRIGMRSTDIFRAYTGLIDEVRVYDRALTAQEVLDLYSQIPPPSDIDPPFISNSQPADALPSGTTSTVMSINTDEPAVCKYTTSPGTNYSSIPDTFSSTGGTTHTTTISNLQDGEINTYFIRCRDQIGNSNADDHVLTVIVASEQPLNDGLVAYWSFDEGSGTAAQDYSGNNHTGTLMNDPLWAPGRMNYALSFDGIDDYVEVNDSNDLDLASGDFTLSAWIYPESYGESENGRIIDHGGGSGGQGGWSFLVNNATAEHNLRISTMNGSTSAHGYSNTGSISLNSWQHAAATLNSGVITFYVNGQNAGQTSGVPSPSDRIGPVRIGMRSTDIFRAYTGLIDEVRIYDRAIPPQYIMDLYNQPPPLSDINPPVISNGQPTGVLPLDTTSATLSVTTDEDAICKYSTSPDTPYSSMTDTFENTGGTTHTYPISGMEYIQSQTYYVKCRDQSSNSNPVDYPVSFSFPRNIYSVSPSGSDSNPGTEASPFASIQYALNDSSRGTPNDETIIKVAQGTYNGNISLACCSSGNTVRIVGGWTSDFSNRDEDPSKTVIDGGGKQRVMKINVPALNLTIEGLTIRNGYDSVAGGGIIVFPFHQGNITLSLTNNIIAHNRAGSHGGGVYVFSQEQATTILNFSDNAIVNNSAENYCGGVCVISKDALTSTTVIFDNNTILDNSSGYEGGGIYLRSYSGATITSTFTNNAITGNSAAYFGGGVYAYSESDSLLTADFTNNIINRNKDVSMGGGVYMHSVCGATITADFKNNIITENSASYYGGGIYTLSAMMSTLTAPFTNNIITGNSAGHEGGGVFTWGTTTSTFTNNTVTGNRAAYLGGGIRMTDGPIVLISKEDMWKYDIENTETTWMDPGYDDSLWSAGGGIFGTEENLDITTPVPNTNMSMFFKKTFTICDPSEVKALTLNSLFDDGMAVYMNGTQVYSENVSGDPPQYNGGVSSQHEAENYEAKDLTSVIGLNALKNLLVTGNNNVIAVGIYNNLPASSDIVWDGELTIRYNEPPSIVNIYNNIIGDNTANSGGDLLIQNDFNGTIDAYNNNFDPLKVDAPFTNEGNNSNVDPLFVAAGYWDDNGTPSDDTDDSWVEGDYHLTGQSECLDAGDNAAPSLPSIDYEGDPRIAGAAVDIGADERYLSSIEKIYYCDYDHDGYMDSIPSTICYRAECETLHCQTVPGTDCDDKDFYEHPNQIWYKDSDNDEYSNGTTDLVSCTRPPGYKTDLELIATSGDCDDRRDGEDGIPGTADDGAYINPGADETWYDGIDQDCDGKNDYDQDRDGHVDMTWNSQAGGSAPGSDDCDDINSAVNPQTKWYTDYDGDSYGNPTTYLIQCDQPAGHVMDNTDCEDNDANIYPGGPRIRIAGGSPLYYNWLQETYDVASTGDTIQTQDAVYTENLIFDLDKALNMEGGYDCSYSVITGITTINGNMVITHGSILLENVELQLPQDSYDW